MLLFYGKWNIYSWCHFCGSLRHLAAGSPGLTGFLTGRFWDIHAKVDDEFYMAAFLGEIFV